MQTKSYRPPGNSTLSPLKGDQVIGNIGKKNSHYATCGYTSILTYSSFFISIIDFNDSAYLLSKCYTIPICGQICKIILWIALTQQLRTTLNNHSPLAPLQQLPLNTTEQWSRAHASCGHPSWEKRGGHWPTCTLCLLHV